jgi:hypothetical protein
VVGVTVVMNVDEKKGGPNGSEMRKIKQKSRRIQSLQICSYRGSID